MYSSNEDELEKIPVRDRKLVLETGTELVTYQAVESPLNAFRSVWASSAVGTFHSLAPDLMIIF